MNTYFKLITETQSCGVCVRPSVGALLPDYIVDLIDDAAAEEVEKHLVVCLHCRKKYQTILRMRGAALRARNVSEGESVSFDAHSIEVPDLGKERQ